MQVIRTGKEFNLSHFLRLEKKRRENILTKHSYFQTHIRTQLVLFEAVTDTHPYKGPSLPIAETMMTLLAVSSQTYKKKCLQ